MGERDLIARLAERIGKVDDSVAVGVGDDAAIVKPGGATATSVDAVVDGVHFNRDTFPLAAIGRKALAAALSDLAAVGAEPGEAYVVLGVPRDLDEAGCIEIHDGIVGLAADTGTSLAGGDVTRSPALFLSVTVVGHADAAEDMVLRSGASAGEVLAVTGELGGAAAGLTLLKHPGLREKLDPESAARLTARQLEPEPRLAAGRALAEAGVTAMIDVSDSVFGDAVLLAGASKVAVTIEAGELPVADGLNEVAAAAGVEPLSLVGGGEDYELLVTVPADRFDAAAAAAEEAGTPLTRIGSTAEGEGLKLQGPEAELAPPPGHDHLR